MDSIYLAVYGTLKQGNHNHDVHLAPKLPIFGDKLILPYQLFSNGRYPMLVSSPDSPKEIIIEIYKVSENQFSAINDLEEPFGYHWEVIRIDNNNLKEVRIFVYNETQPPQEFIKVENGNFQASITW